MCSSSDSSRCVTFEETVRRRIFSPGIASSSDSSPRSVFPRPWWNYFPVVHFRLVIYLLIYAGSRFLRVFFVFLLLGAISFLQVVQLCDFVDMSSGIWPFRAEHILLVIYLGRQSMLPSMMIGFRITLTAVGQEGRRGGFRHLRPSIRCHGIHVSLCR